MCRGYRTISSDAAQVISSMIPIDLLVAERIESKKHPERNKNENRAITLDLWSERWRQNTSGNARWTRKLILDLESWVNRSHGEVGYAMTQCFSGHGCFRHYLFRTHIIDSPKCMYSDSNDDTAEHTMFECRRWESERKELLKKINQKNISLTNLVPAMLQSMENWEAVQSYMEVVISIKEKEAR